MHKLYCVISKESLTRLSGIRGKIMAQAGHAYLHSFWDSEDRFPDDAMAYKRSNSATKVCLVVDTDLEMIGIYNAYKNICGTTMVVDAGRTVFKEPTLTCVGIGPISEFLMGDDLKSLRPLV